VFGTVGTALTFAEICLRIWERLDAFVQKAKVADIVAKELQEKVLQLRICSKTVQRAGRSRSKQDRHGENADKEEIEVWNAINSTLCRCERQFEKFDAALEGLDQGNLKLGWLHKAMLQRKLDKREPRIAALEKKIDRHLTTLQISIQVVHLYV